MISLIRRHTDGTRAASHRKHTKRLGVSTPRRFSHGKQSPRRPGWCSNSLKRAIVVLVRKSSQILKTALACQRSGRVGGAKEEMRRGDKGRPKGLDPDDSCWLVQKEGASGGVFRAVRRARCGSPRRSHRKTSRLRTRSVASRVNSIADAPPFVWRITPGNFCCFTLSRELVFDQCKDLKREDDVAVGVFVVLTPPPEKEPPCTLT